MTESYGSYNIAVASEANGNATISSSEQAAATAAIKTVPRPDPARYRRYDWWYKNETDLFQKIRFDKEIEKAGRRAYFESLGKENRATIKALRNPVHRVVEFYATTMLVGTAKQAFPIRDVEDQVRDGIWTIWGWSNLDEQKQVIKRLVAKHGTCFLKVASPSDMDIVHMQVIDSRYVSNYTRDARRNINYIRLDIPIEPDPEDLTEDMAAQPKKMFTEIWRKGKENKPGYYRTWIRDRDTTETAVLAEKNLGQPNTNQVLSEENVEGSLLFNFVPFVRIASKDDGEKYPGTVYDHSIPLLIEANKMGTRYNDLLFLYNKPHRAIVGIGNDPSGRPYAPPSVPGEDTRDQRSTLESLQHVAFGGELASILNHIKPDETLGGDIWYGAPGTSKIEDITPNLDFEAQRRALLDLTNEIKRELPELLYFETLDKAEISGRALRLIMSGAIDRTIEMRGNIENAMVKWDKMALTMAQVRGLEGFDKETIGVYSPDEGFAHNFEEQDIIAVSDLEDEELRGRRIANMIALVQMGFSREQAAQEVGFAHLAFVENQAQGPGIPATEMTPGTGGNPGGGTNLEGAARQVQRQLSGSNELFPRARLP